MVAAQSFQEPDQDQRVILHDMSWKAFEAMLALRGDASAPRMYYLDGEIELVSPAKIHESRKKTLARLLETWALETDAPLNGFGSWTLKRAIKKAGAEPDECYILGAPDAKDVPDLVIEIEGSRATGLPKHEIYARLGVRELWTLRANGQLVLRVLEKGQWIVQDKSKVIPRLDVAWLVSFLEREPQTEALRGLRDALRKKPRPSRR